MKEYEDDNLVNFFRNRAEGDQYEFREEGWVMMEAKLNAADTASEFFFPKYFWIAVGALLTSLLFFTYLQLKDSSDSEGVTVESKISDARLQSEQEIISEEKNNPDNDNSTNTTKQENSTIIPLSVQKSDLLKAGWATNSKMQFPSENDNYEIFQNHNNEIDKTEKSFSKVSPAGDRIIILNNMAAEGQLLSKQSRIPALAMLITKIHELYRLKCYGFL